MTITKNSKEFQKHATIDGIDYSVTVPLNAVTKKNFKQWHYDGNLLLLGAGLGALDPTLAKLSDIATEWRTMGKQVTRHDIDGNDKKIYMHSNGCDEFVIVTEGKDAYTRQHLTIYVVND